MNELAYKEETRLKKLDELKAVGNLSDTLTTDLKITENKLALTKKLTEEFSRATSNLFTNLNLEELTLLNSIANKYIELFANQYILQLTAKLNTLKFVGADLDFQKDLLAQSSNLLTLNETPGVVDIAKRVLSVDTRKQVALTSVNLFIEKPSHLDKKSISEIKKSILLGHQALLKTIIKEGTEDDLAPAYYDFVQEEKEVYKPFAN